jgi:holliday junction resolvase YEN1
VTDGPQRPKKRNLDIPYGNSDNETVLLRELLKNLGVPWHRAPAEAEAECARLQILGIVDAVWTEDSDALMFGATTVIRFYYKPSGGKPKKNNLRIRVYRSEDILQKYPCLDREGLVLLAVLSGADYNTAGLPNVGPEGAIEAAKEGFGHTLCRASEDGTLQAWREQLQMHLVKTGSKVRVPSAFPNPGHVKCYNAPLVSSTQTLRGLEKQWWNMSFDQDILWEILRHRFNLWLPDYIQLIVPIVLVRSLAQTLPGQEGSNGCYQIQYLTQDGPYQSKISFIHSAVMPIDIDYMVARGFTKDGSRPSDRAECDEILNCILRHGVPGVMKHVALPQVSASSQLNPARKRGRPSKNSSSDTTASAGEQLNPSKKRGRPPKNQVEDLTANGSEQSKRAKSSTTNTCTNVVIPKAQPLPAQEEMSVKKRRQVVDLTSDCEEDKVLTPLSPISQARQARLRRFGPQIPKVNATTPEKTTTKGSLVAGGSEKEQNLMGDFSDSDLLDFEF